MLIDTLERIANLVEFAILLVFLNRDQRRQICAQISHISGRHLRDWHIIAPAPLVLGAG